MNEDIFKAALAGLLHDIGKFAQRAGEGLDIQWDDQSKAEFNYQHALYTDQVVKQIVPDQWRESVRAAAGRHHRPQTHLDRAVALADHLSAGERTKSDETQPRLLQSVFCSIDGLTNEDKTPISPPEDKFLPLKPLAVNEDVIFSKRKSDLDDSHKTYKQLWDPFVTAVMALKDVYRQKETADPVSYINNLLKILQQYTWCIPSAYYHSVSDVSLYDHSRMTAALAACLATESGDKIKTLLHAKPQQHEPAVLLVGGDISGVQKFIYTITSQGAGSGLRGRSLYLQLLTEIVTRYLLDTLGLPMTHVIYAGGGHFYLLAPRQQAAEIARIQKDISRILLHHHQGDLYLALATETLYADELSGDKFRGRWDALQKQLQKNKQRRFADLADELAGLLFKPKEHGGGEEQLCAVCQREHPETKKEYPQDEECPRKCPVCAGFEALGKKLRQAHSLCLDQIEPVSLPSPSDYMGDWTQILSHFGYRVELLSQADKFPPLKGDVQRRSILALTDEAATNLTPDLNQVVGRHFLVNVTPVLTGNEHKKYETEVKDLPKKFDPKAPSVKPFEIMARQSRGIKRLGVLRMDVDDLGHALSWGLGGAKYTLSRLATLSFSVSLFFEGWVEQIATEINEEGRKTKAMRGHVDDESMLLYSIYSGGDDLFFVGAWDLMPLLAERISRDLAAYAGYHPGIHVSGGIALIPSKYPLYQAAEDAAEAEGNAKSPRPDGQAKNAVTFLEQVIPWEKFGQVKEAHETLTNLVDPPHGQKAVPKSLLQRLQKLYIEFDKARTAQAQGGNVMKAYWGPGQWHSAYSLTQLAGRQPEENKAAIKQLKKDLSLEDFKNIEWIGLAARWAGLLTRKGENDGTTK